ncbi:MAG: class I SAM-dependent methyltransferase [Planctomycetota bacterium]
MSLKRAIRRMRVRLGPQGPLVLRLHSELEGQLSMEEVRFLLTTARGRRTIVEIGSFRGKSTVILALGSTDVNGHVTAIDPHIRTAASGTDYGPADLEAFHGTVDRWAVGDRIEHLTVRSEDARPRWSADRPIDLLWIDGDHTYEGVRRDLDDWRELVGPSGIIACHDFTHCEGVRRAWEETVRSATERWTEGRAVRSIVWATRVG